MTQKLLTYSQVMSLPLPDPPPRIPAAARYINTILFIPSFCPTNWGHLIQRAEGADKSMIVTTSRFTDPAKSYRDKHELPMELNDYKDMKAWLSNYDI